MRKNEKLNRKESPRHLDLKAGEIVGGQAGVVTFEGLEFIYEGGVLVGIYDHDSGQCIQV